MVDLIFINDLTSNWIGKVRYFSCTGKKTIKVGVTAEFVEHTGPHIGVPFVAVGRGYFTQVKAYDSFFLSGQIVQQVIGLSKSEASGDGRAGIGAAIGAKTVYIKTDVHILGQTVYDVAAEVTPGIPLEEAAAEFLIGKAADMLRSGNEVGLILAIVADTHLRQTDSG